MDQKKIQSLSQEQFDFLVETRRDIHRHPEPSTKEFRTQKLVIDELKRIGYTEIKTYFNTGVAAVVRGGKPGKTIGIRADMDALSMDILRCCSEQPGCSGRLRMNCAETSS